MSDNPHGAEESKAAALDPQSASEARTTFIIHLISFVVINAFLWYIWATSTHSFAWPLFVTIPWGLWLVARVLRLTK